MPSREEWLTNLPELDYATINTQFNTLMVAMGNLLDREGPGKRQLHDGLPATLRGILMVSANTYRTIAYVCSDSPDELDKRLEYSLAMTPLVRTLLDALFAIVYLFDDPINRPAEFYKGGWREIREEGARYQQAYSTDPEWKEFIAGHERWVAKLEELAEISPSQTSDLKAIPYWPTPSTMCKRLADSDRRRFLEYMNLWFMREMSQDTHLTWAGLFRRFAPIINPDASLQKQILVKAKSDAVGTSLVMMLSIMSELEIELRYGLAERLKYVWTVLNPYFLMSREVYGLRYEGRL